VPDPAAPGPAAPGEEAAGRRADPRSDPRAPGRAMAWCLLGGVAASLLPLPWSLASGGFYLAAVAAGVLTLVRLVRAGRGRSVLGVTTVSAGLALALVMVLGVIVQLALYPLFSEAQTCLDTSLTESGQDACEDEFRQSLLELLTPTR
jgi:hypothetical protein